MAAIPTLFRNVTLTVAGTLLCATTALTANGGALAEVQARYRQDIAVCDSGRSTQGTATCRREARSALSEARRGLLPVSAPDQYQQNARQRCAVHQGEDRTACEVAMAGGARVDGSVSGGGILRETVTSVPSQ